MGRLGRPRARPTGSRRLLSATDVVVSLVMFIVLYALLFVLFLYLMNRKIQDGPEELEEVETGPGRRCRTPSAKSSAAAAARPILGGREP